MGKISTGKETNNKRNGHYKVAVVLLHLQAKKGLYFKHATMNFLHVGVFFETSNVLHFLVTVLSEFQAKGNESEFQDVLQTYSRLKNHVKTRINHLK